MPRTSDQALLLDTHVWVWLEAGSDQLSAGAREEIAAALGGGLLRIAAISLWEIALLASRRRLILGKPTKLWLDQALAEPAPAIEGLSPQIALETTELPDEFHADPADRMIVATARVMNAVLMTRDRRILDYASGGHLSVMAV